MKVQKILDLYPLKAQFKPGEKPMFRVELEEIHPGSVLDVEISHLNNIIFHEKYSIQGEEIIDFELEKQDFEQTGFGIKVDLLDLEGLTSDSKSSAFDVASHWNKSPRYGFLCEFHPEENGKLKDLDILNKLHINIVQFYDWMYRHDQLVPEDNNFTDPLGRKLSSDVIKEKIFNANQKGMATIAYGAIYASLKDFFEKHSEWGLYQNDGIPYSLVDIFYIMDISSDSKWNDHIINEFKRVIEYGFDGIHMDQYGFPKKAWNQQGNLVDMSETFAPFINRTREELSEINPDVGLIFNNVGNFPTYATADAKHDAIYIEVWSPINSYPELKVLIDQTKQYSGDKQVILAAYLAPFNHRKEGFNQQAAENGALTAMATIFANGAYHLLIGEEYKVLTEGYYPNYGEMSETFKRKVRSYYDFIVQYQELLFGKFVDISYTHTGGYNNEIGRDNEIEFQGKNIRFSPSGEAGTVWTIVKENKRFLVIHLLNLSNYKDNLWNTAKESPPVPISNVKVRVLMEENVQGVFFVTPDSNECQPIELKPKKVKGSNGFMLEVNIEKLEVWSVLCFSKSKN
ncbi:glycoside hydrolase family 66 protein [Mesobacillus stamsii]|uniref:Dextranase n=1 Tax=Mesobacillus stamsii TaxID=225347 RepID=A0ABU0G0R8_9BACI|nr:dextranase [Mesobacillus stamsii]